MKYVGLLISSVIVFLVILTNFYYNSITLDIQKIKDYIVESNIILEDVLKKEEYVIENKDKYIKRLVNLKKGIKSSTTSFLVKNYKEYKIKSIEALINSISKSNLKYLEDVDKYNKLSEKELEKILNKSLIEVTSLPINTYI
ncbi:MAG TPA: hypothetical protein K8V90_07365 [Romboutsia timonensis]|uniref:Uncharacterized protein n=1 Tax=Romboutsia timonensis TaxID=1776391 RepID=A0A921N158_9FIRM|nr:hypothetical protein [uncultured Romboutsia sp.]HJG96901.1 hypothetical protein [Romboutsia timonensis]